MIHRYTPFVSVYYTAIHYRNNEQLIQQAISQFKTFYSRFDKRIATTKKAVNVNLKGTMVNVSLTFNKVHYSQCYEIKDGVLNGQRINY